MFNIIIIYLFIYLFIYLPICLYSIFAGRFSGFCFSAPNQNVSHNILNALDGFGS